MKDLILTEWHKLNAEYYGRFRPLLALQLISRLVSLAFQWLITRYYLRSCKLQGKLIFTQGKPKVVNKGTIRVSNRVRIWSTVNQTRLSVGKGGLLEVGENTRLNGPTISATHEVRIGKHCRIAPHVIIMDGDFHDVNDRLSEGKKQSIIIEDHAWVATRAMVLKGVRIGKGAVVAAGSVVTKDVPDYTVVAGVPARIVKTLKPAQV
jgi:acetyltransferase-like isoleucine patch superfamily enzyme